VSYVLATWTAPDDGPLAGTTIEITRADGKGFTACWVTGPRAAEIRDFVRARVEAVEVPHGRRTPHVRCALTGDYSDGARTVYVYGRLRQTRDVILRALEGYSSRLAGELLGQLPPPARGSMVSVTVPVIRPKAPELPCATTETTSIA
jgi:hypothetical protein